MTSATLPTFADEAWQRVRADYYDVKRLPAGCPPKRPPSLRAALTEDRGTFPVIAEVKPASPTAGAMRADVDAGDLARTYLAAGARGVSVLAERERFGGSPENVMRAAAAGGPVLWKDFVVAFDQLKCARRCGASAVLLILDQHTDDLAEADVDTFVERAHDAGLEVLLEVYDAPGLRRALQTQADLIGVNNRDLRKPGLPIDLDATGRALEGLTPDRPVLGLSGVASRADVERLRKAGAHGALVGSSLMRADDPAAKLRELIRSG